jgi:hypothetical protein
MSVIALCIVAFATSVSDTFRHPAVPAPTGTLSPPPLTHTPTPLLHVLVWLPTAIGLL